MKPSGIFKEYEEMDLGTHVSFKGKLHMRYFKIPKSQLAFSILNGKAYKDFSIKINGDSVDGVVVRQEPIETQNTNEENGD